MVNELKINFSNSSTNLSVDAKLEDSSKVSELIGMYTGLINSSETASDTLDNIDTSIDLASKILPNIDEDKAEQLSKLLARSVQDITDAKSRRTHSEDSKDTVQSISEKGITNAVRSRQYPLVGGSSTKFPMSGLIDEATADALVNSIANAAEFTVGDTTDKRSQTPLSPAQDGGWDVTDPENQGIRYKNGESEPYYRCRYYCPNCSLRSNRYMKLYSKYCVCHQCKTKLEIQAATEEGRGRTSEYQDSYGNFLVANRKYEVSPSDTREG
ncbi:hypothetical protein LIS04_148 [Listeria phage LIS04]|nr:hypothetical protein LIS04_148 [Listeria phage LIS04]